MLRAITTATLGDVARAVVKATYADDDPPKKKHVDSVLSMSHSRAQFELLEQLKPRLDSSNWTVVVKSLYLVHKLCREGTPAFLQAYSEQSHITNLHSYTDTEDLRGFGQTHFVRAYSDYLTEKAFVFKNIRFSVERAPLKEGKSWAFGLNMAQLEEVVSLLQSQLDLLFKCKVSGQPHPAIGSTLLLLIKDAFKLHSVLHVLMLAVVDKFQSMDSKLTRRVIASCIHFQRQSENFKQWAERLVRKGVIEDSYLTAFEAIPGSFLTLLQQHLESATAKENAQADLPPLKTLTLDDSDLEVEVRTVGRKKKKKNKHGKKKELKKQKERRVSNSDANSESSVEVRRKMKSKKKAKSRQKRVSSESDSSCEAKPTASKTQTGAKKRPSQSARSGDVLDFFSGGGEAESDTAAAFSALAAPRAATPRREFAFASPPPAAFEASATGGYDLFFSPPPNDTRSPSVRTVSHSNATPSGFDFDLITSQQAPDNSFDQLLLRGQRNASPQSHHAMLRGAPASPHSPHGPFF